MFRLIESLLVFDIISPTATLLRNVLSGPTHTFGVPTGCGWSGQDAEQVLRQNGIDSWCHMTINHTYLLTVRRSDALRAQSLLEELQVPITSRRLAAGKQARRSWLFG